VPQIAVTMATQIRNALRYFDMTFPQGGAPRWHLSALAMY
jgi:hypothetical protein